MFKFLKNTKTLKSGKNNVTMRRPFFVLSIQIIFVIVSYYFVNFYLAIAFSFIFMCFNLIFCKSILKNVFAFILFASIIFSIFLTEKRIDKTISLNNTEIKQKFTVCSDVESGKKTDSVLVKCNNGKNFYNNQAFNLYFRKGTNIKCGQIITATVSVFETDNEECKCSLKINNAYGNLWLKGFTFNNKYNYFYRFCGLTRKYIKDILETNLSPDAYATVVAIMLGDKTNLSEKFSANIKNSGVSHIMVVSGLHLSIIMGVLLFIIKRTVSNKYLRFFITAICLVLICGISGFTISVIRASIMFAVVAIADLIGRENDNLNTIGFTVVAILISSPLLLFNISFDLSVISVYSIICIAPYFGSKCYLIFRAKSIISKSVINIIVDSIIAQIFTAPIIIYYFETFSIIAPITNLFISVAVTCVFVFAFIGIAFIFVLPISNVFFTLCDIVAKYINLCINSFGSLPFSSVKVDSEFFFLPLFLIFFILLYVYKFSRRENRGNT